MSEAEPTEPTRGKALSIPLRPLEPFASEPERALTFSDLQAAFGSDLHTTQKIIRVLRAAQLVSTRSHGRSGNKPTYVIESELVKLLTGRRPQRVPRAKALECAAQVLDAVAAHNGEHPLARVTRVEFKGSLMEPSAAALECVEVQVTVAVKPEGTLVQDIAALLRRLRHVGNGVLRESLVLVVN
jgi:hypothetical protein